MNWYVDKKQYSLTKQTSSKPEIISSHQTLLLRVLKDVDMWLQHNKVTNLKIAIKQINGVIVQPEETLLC